MKRKVVWGTLASFVLSVFYFSSLAQAQDADLVGLIQGLQKQMAALQATVQAQNAEIQELKAKGVQIQIAPKGVEATAPMSEAEYKQRLTEATGGADKWLKDLKFGGDLRLRYEAFNLYGNTACHNLTAGQKSFPVPPTLRIREET